VKLLIQRILQKILGFNAYLNLFSAFKIFTLKWDKKENDFFLLLKLIPPGSLVLDIGANIGIMTYYLAHAVGKSGKVYSFEPHPDNYKVLNQSAKRFNLKNVSTFAYGLGEKPEVRELIMPVVKNVKMQGLSYISDPAKKSEQGTKYSVKIDALDNIHDIFNSSLPLEAIKIDVENFEYLVLKGAEKTISKFKPIIYCELWENENRENSINFLASLGYKTMVSGKEGLIDYTDQKKQNFFFIPKENPV